jgi:HAD superfamily hydrolase (TIGR01549 family)
VKRALQAVLFDWDGTLVDSAEASFLAYAEAFRSCGIHFGREDYERTYSPNWHRTYEAMGLDRDRWADVDSGWLQCFSRQTNVLMPGARETLTRLGEAALVQGLVTSGERSRVTRELAGLKLDHFFQAVVCGDDTEHRKPHPEPLLVALARLGLPPGQVAYVGDSPEDIEMARAAGALTLGIPGPFPNREALARARPDILATDLTDAADRLLA